MRLLLINPRNSLINITNKKNYWNKFRVWKPLGLLVLGLTVVMCTVSGAIALRKIRSADPAEIF